MFVQREFSVAQMTERRFSTELSTDFGENRSVKVDRCVEIEIRYPQLLAWARIAAAFLPMSVYGSLSNSARHVLAQPGLAPLNRAAPGTRCRGKGAERLVGFWLFFAARSLVGRDQGVLNVGRGSPAGAPSSFLSNESGQRWTFCPGSLRQSNCRTRWLT
jgi:hypothetical protein